MNQVLALQELTVQTAAQLKADMNQADCDRVTRSRLAAALAQVCRAWDALDDRRRILKGKPLPGSLRQADAPKRTARPKAATITDAEKIVDLPNAAAG